jgi:hypothetical protein
MDFTFNSIECSESFFGKRYLKKGQRCVVTNNVTLRPVLVTIVAVEKQLSLSNILSVCVSVALVIQHEKRIRRITLSSVVCLAVPGFPTLCNKRHDFRGGEGVLMLLLLLVIRAQSQGSGCTAAIRIIVHPVF